MTEKEEEEKVEELKISDKRVIAEIREIQKYLKAKGETASESEIVQSCINIARRLGAENWGIYLEVTHVYDKCFEEVK